ncbi:MAG TPA: hypothetical protein VFF52_23145 [Isosphaeraceae bacterium]|nr:hypothetical protein [Isosphaeraceae bacterium]
MATAKSTTTEQILDIQRRMAQMRHELHVDAREVVKGAQSLTDWRSLVRNHPWLSLSAAAAVGYLIVPRRAERPTVVAVSPPVPVSAAATPAPPERPPRRNRWGILSTVMGLLGPIAVRAAQNYALQAMEQWLAAQPRGGPLPTGPGGGTGRPTTPFGAPGRPREAR